MNKTAQRGNLYLTWVLRILLILTILFWTLFSADVFEEGLEFWDTVMALLIHNIPSFVMIIILVIAWQREDIGGILLMLGILGFASFIYMRSDNFMWGTVYMLATPFMIGGLLIINYYLLGYNRADKKTAT